MSALPLHWVVRLRSLAPPPSNVSLREKLRATLGALLAVLLTGAFTHFIPGHGQASAWLVAPMAARAVLLLVLPSSPMTQPWPVIGGSVLSARCLVTKDVPAGMHVGGQPAQELRAWQREMAALRRLSKRGRE